jgi:hypothetical protein
MGGALRTALRRPLAQFVLGGAALFVAVHGTRLVGGRRAAATPVVLTAEDVARLRRDHARDTGAEPSPADEAALVERAVEEDLLWREALARGLDRDRSVRNWLVEQMRVLEPDGTASADTLYARAVALGLDRTDLVVRRILVQKMRLLAERADERPPSDDVLRAYWAAHAAEYRGPARTTLWQVFLADAAPGAAERRLAELRRDGVPPADAVRRGDTFAAPPHLERQSAADLTRRFGRGFADAVAAAPVGAWSGPIATPYGAHLVWVEARTPTELPPLDVVRGQLRERWLAEQRTRRLADTLRTLAARHPLHVESAAWHERHRS